MVNVLPFLNGKKSKPCLLIQRKVIEYWEIMDGYFVLEQMYQ